ncbi:MAG: 4Fe-4S dicluster domain-containing protein [Peptococcaceae bacterium]
MPPVIDQKKCIKCAKCAQICCMDIFGPARVKEVPEIRYSEECWHCNACVLDCPVGAVTLRYPLPLMLLAKDAVLNSSAREGN